MFANGAVAITELSLNDMTSVTRFCGLKLIRVLYPEVVSQEPSQSSLSTNQVR